MSNLEDLLYEIHNSGHYEKVMELYPKIKAREPYKEIEEIYDIAYKMILDDKLFVRDNSNIIIADFTMYSVAAVYFILKFQSFIISS